MDALPNTIKNQLLHKIDKVGGLTGIGVVLNRDDFPEVLRKPASGMCLAAGDYLVIDMQTKPSVEPKQVAREAGLAAINCSAMIVASLVTFGSAATSPLTGRWSGINVYRLCSYSFYSCVMLCFCIKNDCRTDKT
jgi:hypothetical protein